jgi:hypothetical protein
MDALLRAGVPTEVCRVEERGHAEKMKNKKKTKNRNKRARHEPAHCLEDDLCKINSCDLSLPEDFDLEPCGSKRRAGEGSQQVVSARPSKRPGVGIGMIII